MVKNSACGSNEYVNLSPSELPCLIVDGNTAINCKDTELLVVMLQVVQNSGNLKCQLSRRSEDDTLNLSLTEEIVCT